MTRIIVFGVSGVGKTTACRGFVAGHPEYLHFTASDLIRKITGTSLTHLREADAGEILKNQHVLEKALELELKNRSALKVIIDGQCLVDNGRELVPIPPELIAPLHPTGFILLEESSEEILRRRAKDARPRPPRTEPEIAKQIELNREIVAAYAALLSVPFVHANAGVHSALDIPMARLASE